ncbi:MAG: restriction endonuclease subunit S, partial [Selenomonadaceae bacterium]|nr:restriction endonuclease subunit S [Selenomonadaceae bacterium]
SKLDELIKKYCPNGVEYKKLGEVASVERGKRVVREQLSQNNGFPVYQNSLTIMGYHNATNYSANTPFIIGAGAAGEVGYSIVDFWAADDCFPIVGKAKVLNMYIYHVLLWKKPYLISKIRKASIPRLSRDFIVNMVIPVPPLPVLEEIVRILDSFTSLTAELQAELQARKKQYEYYADKLFVSDIPTEDWMSVGDTIQSLKTGLNPRQSFKLNVGGDKPYITGKNIYNNSINVSEKTDLITDDVISLINKRACLATGDVLFASTGTGTVGRMAVVDNYDFSWSVSETIFCLKPKKSVIHPYYLMYALYTQSAKNQFEPRISKGSVPHLKVKDLLEVKIPVPNMKEQKRIINLMRKFDSLCNNISQGLPAEIAARQKQYEYYRDKLLTFKKLS